MSRDPGRVRALSIPSQTPVLRLALAVISAIAMIAVSMVWIAPSSGATGPTVVISDSLSPQRLSITPGTTVTWVNRDDQRHRMRAEDGAIEFDSGNIDPGERWSYTYRKAGVASYHDHEDHADTAYYGKITVGKETRGGTGGSPSTGPAAPSRAKVSIADNFGPVKVTVAAGGVVTWTNQDGDPHTVTASDGSFDSGAINPGQSWSHRFAGAGSFEYYCMFHPDMRGTVAVPDKAGNTPQTAPGGGSASPSAGSHNPHAQPSATGGSAGASPSGSKASSHTVSISDTGYSPAVLNARVGDQVTWVNAGQMPHTVTGGPWDAQVMPGQSFTTVLRETGTVDYVCSFHASMRGTVKISAAPAGTKLPPHAKSHAPAKDDVPTESAPTADASAEEHVVSIKNFTYSPQSLEAKVGDTVTFVNEDSAPHTATASDESFDSGMLEQGDEFTLKLTEEGTLDYLCTYHPDMVGEIVVRAADAPATSGSEAEDTEETESSVELTVGQMAGFGSGWLLLLAFLAGTQLRSRRLTSRR